MEFKNLLSKINDLDKNIQQLNEIKENKLEKDSLDLDSVKKLSGLNESGCGMPSPSMPPSNPPVTMNLSMNATGKESIRDLLDLLKGGDIDGGSVEGPKGMIVSKEPSMSMDQGPEGSLIKKIGMGDLDEKFINEPEETYATVDKVIPTGDDLASKGKEAPKVNGGGNPMQENIKSKLSSLYQEIKNR